MAQTQDNAIKIVQAALRSDRDFETYKPQIIQKIKASDEYSSFSSLHFYCHFFQNTLSNFLFHCSKILISNYLYIGLLTAS